MKILLITDLYPIRSGESNSPRTLHNFVLEWIKQNNVVDVIKPNFIFNSILRSKPLYKTGFYEFEGVKIFNVNYFTPFLFNIEKKLTNPHVFARNGSSTLTKIFHRSSGFSPESENVTQDCETLQLVSRRIIQDNLPQDSQEIASVNNLCETPSLMSRNDDSYDLIIAHMPSGIIFANNLIDKKEKRERKKEIEAKSKKQKVKSDDSTFYPLPFAFCSENTTLQSSNPPLICGVHSSDIEVLTNPLYKLYFKPQLEQAYSKAQKIACRSHVLQKKFAELYPGLAEKTFVAASGVNIKKEEIENGEQGFEAKSQKQKAKSNESTFGLLPLAFYPENPSPIKVLTCANLIKRKNIDKLILAIKDLEGLELTIIGDGKELKGLKKISRSGILARQQKVKFLGKLPQEKVFEQMQNSHIFILPSMNETFGMVYLEAMANGCVTVCSKNDGIDGIIKDGENGFLTPSTIEGIKETLFKIKDFENLDKIVENSLATVKNYTPELCAQNYLENCQK